MSVQEMKYQLYQLVERADNESALEQLLEQAREILANQTEPERDILDDLTPAQQASLERALEQHRTGQTISHEVMKIRIDQWLNK